MNDQMKHCVDCRWFVPSKDGSSQPMCRYPGSSMNDGEYEQWLVLGDSGSSLAVKTALEQRKRNLGCGHMAIWFSEKGNR